MFVWYESSEQSMHTSIFCYLVPSICHWTSEQQSSHITGFLHVIYAILNASVILERNEKCFERNETRLERNETCLARNKTRGGNLLLGGTVHPCTVTSRSVAALQAKCMFWLLTALKDDLFPERIWNVSFHHIDSNVVFEVIWQISGNGLLKINRYTS